MSNDAPSNLSVVPADFTRPTSSYRRHAWLAVIGLLLFVALYVGLASWFTYTAYRMISGVFEGGDGAFAGFLAALPSAFLAIFMWKALFFVRRGADKPGVEITPAEQPELFAFLQDLADEVRAPRPHRVFLSPEVNASVFYDLSILNFILPSKKNLVIGLGLVNVLTQTELKAVLAHEFGHFAQRSMAVGRWVYVGEQIARHIVAGRGVLDRTLDFISAIDLRIAWIGWIMRTVVWSIRSLFETVFDLVLIAQRALSREMEFQADLVAVSVTGSDALVHGLFHLQPADEDWQLSLDFANAQLAEGKVVTELFAVQTRIGEHMQRILSDPAHRRLPPVPVSNPEAHRIFTEQIAQPPRMWSTHPPNTEREENAKRTYLPMRLEKEPAWNVFRDQEQLRTTVTSFLIEGVQFEKQPTSLTTDEALEAVDEKYMQESFNADYRGAYLGRGATTAVAEADELIGTLEPQWQQRPELLHELDSLYPENLQDLITEWRNQNEEVALLEAVEAGTFDPTDGAVRHRGVTVDRKELPQVIDEVKQQRDQTLDLIQDHDRQCRTVHQAAARYVAHGWGDYLQSLRRLLHYLEHSEADLNDAAAHLANTTSVAVATGRVSQKKLRRLIASGTDLHGVMRRLDRDASKVKLPESVLTTIKKESWRQALEKLDLPAPNDENIGQWINVIDGWLGSYRSALAEVRQGVLNELLLTEKRIATTYRQEATPETAPHVAEAPMDYAKRPQGEEREQQKKLDWWSRFTLAQGMGPAIMRFSVAATIVAAVVVGSLFVGNATVTIYNGLAIPVTVAIDGTKRTVSPGQHASVSIGSTRQGTVEARTADGRLIESLDVALDKGFANYVYNVAGAAPLVEWTAVYGNVRERPPEPLGFPRWRTTAADHIFSEPPRQVKTKSSGSTRRVLSKYPPMSPSQLLGLVDDPLEKQRIIETHATWDAADSRYIAIWLSLAQPLPAFKDVLQSRLQANPNEVLSLRLEQDTAEEHEQTAVNQRHRLAAQQNPDDPGWQYVAIRTLPDGPEQDQQFIAGFKRWPDNPWFANAVGYHEAKNGNWQAALSAYKLLLENIGPMSGHAAQETARIRRFVAGDSPPDLSDLRQFEEFDIIMIMENGEQEVRGSPTYAYSLKAQGKLADAYQVGGGNNAEGGLLALLAASEGAEPDWQRRALELPLSAMDNPAQLLALGALAFRVGQPHEKYLQKYADVVERPGQQDANTALTFIRKVIEKGPNPELESELKGLLPKERGLAQMAAVVMYPEKSPRRWRAAAKRLLFALERPYLADE